MEFDVNLNDWTRPGSGDERLLVVFYMGIVQDEAASAEQGRPIFRDTEMVRIFTPGDKSNVIDRPVRSTDKQRFAQAYAAFKNGGGEEEQVIGTPLKEWPAVGRAMAEELRHLGIRTVEAVAEVRDDVCMRVPGLTGLKQAAQVWLDKAKATAVATKSAKEMEALRNENEVNKRAIKELMDQVQTLTTQLEMQLRKRAPAG